MAGIRHRIDVKHAWTENSHAAQLRVGRRNDTSKANYYRLRADAGGE